MDIGFNEIFKLINNELLKKAKSMEMINDIKDLDKPIAKMLDYSDHHDNIKSNSEKLESNTKYEIDGDIFETDDNGTIFKKNGELIPDSTYERNSIKYTTDDKGRISSWDGSLC